MAVRSGRSVPVPVVVPVAVPAVAGATRSVAVPGQADAGATQLVAVPGPGTLRLLAVLSLAALGCAAGMSPDQAVSGPVLCPVRLLTGLPCPGCGLTRAWVFAMHGDLARALSANPFVLVTLPAAVVLVVVVSVAAVRRRPPPDVRPLLSSLLVRVLLAGWLGFAVVRAIAVLSGRATV